MIKNNPFVELLSCLGTMGQMFKRMSSICLSIGSDCYIYAHHGIVYASFSHVSLHLDASNVNGFLCNYAGLANY